ncbi:MAG: hypothetical protein HYU66_06415 [Armatimonadetes bacterium]|nr:hypothetical protein [Armatimonadota bacterium]
MKRLLPVLCGVLALAGPRADDPAVTLRLKLAKGEKTIWSERLTGHGELVRQAGGQRQTLPVEVRSEAERRWSVDEQRADGWRLTARCARAEASLRLADDEFRDARPQRSFALHVGEHGAILAAEVIEEPTARPSAEAGLPLDLDLGELFCMTELGLLPAGEVKVDEPWGWPEVKPGDPGDAGKRVATLVTALHAPVPERATPAPGVIAEGELSGRFTIRFAVEAGRVNTVTGPLDLTLRFRQGHRGAVLASLTLHLTVQAERLEVAPGG